MQVITVENNLPVYHGDTFKIRLVRYSDPKRLNAARNAARYLGKTDIENIRRPLSIIRQGHVPEIFRGEFAEFEFEDVSKEVYDHIITYTTRNLRVAGGNRALTSDSYTLPSDKMKNPIKVLSAIDQSMNGYKELLESGETPQVARAAMPISAKLNLFVYQFNFLTLGQSLFKQRIWEKGAQGNTVKVVQGMYELCKYMDEELWNTFYEWYGEPASEWVEVRRKLKKQKMTVNEFVNRVSECDDDVLLEDWLNQMFGQQKSMW
jgi:PAS domain-containing protein